MHGCTTTLVALQCLIALSQVIVTLRLVLHCTLSTFSTYEPRPDAHPSLKSDLMSAFAGCVEALVRIASAPAISIEPRISHLPLMASLIARITSKNLTSVECKTRWWLPAGSERSRDHAAACC
jgi:hypothetical protein